MDTINPHGVNKSHIQIGMRTKVTDKKMNQ